MKAASPPALALVLALAAAPAARADGPGEEPVQVLELTGKCSKATVRKEDWTSRCAGTAYQARYRDGHQTLLFFIEGAASVLFRGAKDYRKEPKLHFLLLDLVRIKKSDTLAAGFCMFTGAFADKEKLLYRGKMTIRCRAGPVGAADVADITFQVTSPPTVQPPKKPTAVPPGKKAAPVAAAAKKP